MPATSTIPSAETLFETLRAKVDHALDEELREKARVAHEIHRLKRERNAVILGHNYMEPALYHSIPDFVGDSLGLSRKAAETDRDVIVFCGVRFMAETAKILNPEKTVLLPAEKAGCSLAASITAEDVRRLKKRYPGVPVVTYINTYAEVKAETDICCTSSNAAAVVESLDSDTVIFLPDEFLARNVAQETGKHIIFPSPNSNGTNGADTEMDVQMIGWTGRCEVHDQFFVEDIEAVRKDYPDVEVLAHPECRPEVVEAADYAGSTSAMIEHVKQTDAKRILLLTECSMGDNIMAENPDKEILRRCWVRCPHMDQITLEDTRDALRFLRYQTEIPEDIRARAERSVQRMLEIG